MAMTETPQELIARLRSGIHRTIQITLGGVTHDQRCLEAADAIAASLAREEVLQEALAEAKCKASFNDAMRGETLHLLLKAEAALATARGALAQYSCRCIGPMPDCAQGGVADCGWTARDALALIPARPTALS
jgi:hypothetical protein